jgi:alkylhydroperoxidase/carboxymuconolactone decarboxylase family protein YurZ
MQASPPRTASTTRLAEVNPEAMEHYRQMRARVMPVPGIDAGTCEIVLAMQLALLGHEAPFKIHATRAMAQGVSLAQLEALVMAGVGVTLIVFEAARAVEWLREAHAEFQQAARPA